MRKIKLQMQLTLNGFVAGPNGEMDWMTWSWDDELKKHVSDLTATIDTILLGRKLAEGFIPHWASVAATKDSPEVEFGKLMSDTPKVVFSKTLKNFDAQNTNLETGDAVAAIKKLKSLPGKDIMVYGGASFAGFLAAENLIDEFHLFMNPTAIPHGLAIFDQIAGSKKLDLVNVKSFSCGVTDMTYVPSKA
jgi:dihydrofolate reductase